MNAFKWASIQPTDVYMTKWCVIISDAETPIQHLEAVRLHRDGLYTKETVIQINEFSSIRAAEEYCRERNFTSL